MTQRKVLLAAIALLSVLALFPLAPAQAFLGLFEGKEIRQDETQKTLTETIVDEESFKKNTKIFADIPYSDTSLEYEILLPNDWKNMSIDMNNAEDTTDINRKLLGKLGYYQGPIIGSSRPFMTLYAVELEHEIAAKDWLENYVLNTGSALQAPASAPSAKSATASYISFQGLLAFDISIKMLIYNNIAILVQVGIPLNAKENLSFLQSKAIESFHLRTPKEGNIESVKTFTIADALKFSYPDSWKIAYPDLKDSSRPSVQLQNHNASNKIDGIIQFLAISRSPDTNIKLEIQRLKELLSNVYKLNIKSMVSSEVASAYSRFIFARQEVYNVGANKDGPAEKELLLVTLGDKEWYIFIYLITPTRNNSLYIWARNTRAFDLVIQSLK